MKSSLSVLGLCLAALLTACGGGDPPEDNKIKTLVAYADIFAGGTSTITDGTGAIVSFASPYGLAVGSTGDVYVVDGDSIRKITPAGLISNFATIGGAFLYGVAVDASGNVYASSRLDGRIYKITPLKVVNIFAGSSPGFSNNSTGTMAQFNFPAGLAVDVDNNVYVADSGNNAIRKINSSGTHNVTTVAGTGAVGSTNDLNCPSGPSCASFNYPMALTVDSTGNIFVADKGNEMIRKISFTGVVTTLAGSGTTGDSDGTGVAAGFKSPSGVTNDSAGNLYVVDSGNHMIRKITSAGVVTTIAGTTRAGKRIGYGYSARFDEPTDIAIDRSSGAFYVSDGQRNNMIRKLTLSMQ